MMDVSKIEELDRMVANLCFVTLQVHEYKSAHGYMHIIGRVRGASPVHLYLTECISFAGVLHMRGDVRVRVTSDSSGSVCLSANDGELMVTCLRMRVEFVAPEAPLDAYTVLALCDRVWNVACDSLSEGDVLRVASEVLRSIIHVSVTESATNAVENIRSRLRNLAERYPAFQTVSESTGTLEIRMH